MEVNLVDKADQGQISGSFRRNPAENFGHKKTAPCGRGSFRTALQPDIS
jgi:hypothetical protein